MSNDERAADAAVLAKVDLAAVCGLPAVRAWLHGRESDEVARKTETERFEHGGRVRGDAIGAMLPLGLSPPEASRLLRILTTSS